MALDLVAPIIPNAQENKAPELFAQSYGTGLAGAARFSEMKRQSEMELLKLAEHERLSQEHDALEREKMAMDADYRAKMLDATSEVNHAHARYFDAQADYWKNEKTRLADNLIAFNRQKERLKNEVNEQANNLKLNDPEFATKEPVQYGANYLQFEDMYKLSPLEDVQKALKQFRMIADQQKIPLKMSPDSKPQNIPIWKVVQKLNDPDQKEQMMEVLKDNGHFSEEVVTSPGTATKSWSRPIDSMWDAIIGPTPKKTTVDKPSPTMQRILDKSKGIEFKREQSRVPPVMLRRSEGKGTSGPTPMPDDSEPALPAPDPDLPDPQASAKPPLQFEPSDTDKIIMQAKAAIAKGAPQDAVLARLQQMGISPEALA